MATARYLRASPESGEFEPWNGWQLTLMDGTVIEGPRPGAFKDIPTERMRMLAVFDEGRAIRVDLDGIRRPIITRRVSRGLNLASGAESAPSVTLGVGWRTDDGDVRVWIDPDGTVTLTPRHIKELD